MVNRTSTAATAAPAASTGFVRGNDRLERMLADPATAERVEAILAEGDELDRIYAMNLAMVRKAGELTQAEIAHRLGTDQGNVSRLERQEDMLLSTLASYLSATGAVDVAITMTVNGRRVELSLVDLQSTGKH
jgi:DNA-binding transcriptional regulator YiaG